MEITLLGTGDTTGTPTAGCECATCARARERGIERSRFSVHVRNERTDEALLVDASPDFRQQFLRTESTLPDAVIISHIHFDHLDGLGNVFRLCKGIPVLASSQVDEVTGESVAETVDRRYDYLDAITVDPVAPLQTQTVCGFEIQLIPVSHPPLDSYGVVIEDPETGVRVGITGDTNFAIPDESREQLRDVDLLIADAIVHADFCDDHPAGGRHYNDNGVPRTFGRKHMTREGALSLGSAVNADRIRLVHVSHFYPPDAAFADPLAVDGEQHFL